MSRENLSEKVSRIEERVDRLEKAVMDTVNSGIMTQDLARLYEGEAQTVTSRMFLYAVASKLPAAE